MPPEDELLPGIIPPGPPMPFEELMFPPLVPGGAAPAPQSPKDELLPGIIPPGPPMPFEELELLPGGMPPGGLLPDVVLAATAAWSAAAAFPEDAVVDEVPVHPAKAATARIRSPDTMNHLLTFIRKSYLFHHPDIPPISYIRHMGDGQIMHR